MVSVLTPFPDIARHVMQSVAVGRIAADGGGQEVTILQAVLVREPALPNIGVPWFDGIIPPGMDLLLKSSS